MHTRSSDGFQITIRLQYFTQFGVMGIFLPFFNLYCYHIGFDGFQIGVLSSLRSATMVLSPLIWGALADRFRKRRPIFIFCSFTSTAIWVLYFFTLDFRIILFITLGYTFFYAPLISFLEAFTVDVLGPRKKSYGRVRVWGSVAFILSALAVGKMLDYHSINSILILILAGLSMQALISVHVPRHRAAEETARTSHRSLFSNPKVIIFLVSAFLMLVSHGAYYAFFSIHLEGLGFGKGIIGLSWAFASIAEIVVMLKADSILQRFSLPKVLLCSFIVAALRWLILFFSTSFYIIFASQLLHAVTYGAFHIASILYIDALTPATSKTLGQAVNNAFTYGLGLMVGFFISGVLYESVGAFNMFLVSSLTALSALAVFAAYHLILPAAGGGPGRDA